MCLFRFFLFTLPAMPVVGFVGAQSPTHYTYITDRKFSSSEELLGYTFVPQRSENPATGLERRFNPGEVFLRITPNYVFFKNGNNEQSFSTTTITPERYGYKISLMNARDPTKQGHLKVIVNAQKHVEALVLKQSREDTEVIYHIPSLVPSLQKSDDNYYTDRLATPLMAIDSIWGRTVYPFFKTGGLVQTRVYPEDSLSFSFIKKVKVIVKEKPRKDKMEEAPSAISDTITSSVDSTNFVGHVGKKPKEKVITEYYMKMRFWDSDKQRVEEDLFTITDSKRIKGRDEKGGFEITQLQIKGLGVVLLHPSERQTLSAIELPNSVFLLRDRLNQVIYTEAPARQ